MVYLLRNMLFKKSAIWQEPYRTRISDHLPILLLCASWNFIFISVLGALYFEYKHYLDIYHICICLRVKLCLHFLYMYVGSRYLYVVLTYFQWYYYYLCNKIISISKMRNFIRFKVEMLFANIYKKITCFKIFHFSF